MAESSSPQPARRRPNTPGGMFIRDLPPGTKVRLSNGAIVEVVQNANDGGWLLGRYLENEEDPETVGTEDWIFFADVSGEVN